MHSAPAPSSPAPNPPPARPAKATGTSGASSATPPPAPAKPTPSWANDTGASSNAAALVAVARSILVIIWNLLSHPGMRYHDLGSDYHTKRIDTERRTRNHIRQLEAPGYTVTLTAAA